MNILIAGLGALGTVHGCLLKKAGHTVHGLTREKYLPAFARPTVSVTGIWGEHEATLNGVHASIEPLRSTLLDLVLVTVKSYDTAQMIEEIRPLVGPDTLVLCAQNGYGNYETVAAAVGPEHTLLARVIFGVKLHGPGKAEVTVIADATRIGQPDRAVPPERIKAVAGAINASGIPAEYAEDITAILWDKILYNAALNPLGAILECSYGTLADSPETRAIMDQIIDEIFSVCAAHKIPLRWTDAGQYRAHFYTRLVPPTAAHFPSMYYDLKAGKRVEIDALNGAIVRLARQKQIAAPVNETITGLLRAKGAARPVQDPAQT
jgi:2-dehydropantoate 2-reductase